MVKITIANNGQQIETTMVHSLLVSLQVNEIPIQTECGGRAMCGKCLIRLIDGEGKVSPKTPCEIQRLKSLVAGEDMRLACQTFAGKDLEIEIIV